jgi:hypothetical protein
LPFGRGDIFSRVTMGSWNAAVEMRFVREGIWIIHGCAAKRTFLFLIFQNGKLPLVKQSQTAIILIVSD